VGRARISPLEPRKSPVGTFRYEKIKRVLDVFAAAALLLPSLPLAAAVALFILWDSGRPVLLSQIRVGRFNRRFRLWKFRTLPREALELAHRQWAADAHTEGMAFLRKTGLDELPQLFNILVGDMSFVGPRPERPYFSQRFDRVHAGYRLRRQLVPGLTGLAQVRGWRGNTSIERRLSLDLTYLETWSLALDGKILAATGSRLFRTLSNAWQAASGKRRDARAF
jgi:lipopolysaccharide/colanic/teichoic acid biosynthesis glycosyltransferase